ncbi:MAG: ABC transporter ATP-binding protein/permease [Lachnospiraceae bacterium]|nr:ABC transporter ATP-binding protein/permease [Lachnospiraceae bacterium]
MKRLLVYLKEYKIECVLAPLFKMLEASFELFVPLVIAYLIDKGIVAGDKSVIIKAFILLLVLGLIGLIASVTAQFFSAKAAVGFATKLRHALFEKLLSLGFPEIDKLGTGAMITRMTSDVNQLQNGVNMFLRLFLRSPFVVFGAMIMAFTIDFDSAMVFLIVIIALSIVVFGLMAINVKQVKNVQSKLESVLIATRENLKGVRVIRAFCKEREESIEFENDNDMLTKALNKAGNISALMNPLTYVMINVAIITLIKIDAVKVSQGSMTQGTVVALYNYMSQILVELIKLANLIVLLNKTLACSNRVSSVFDIVPSQTDGIKDAEKSNEVIRFDHVSLEYPESGEETLSDISFAVNKGETVGIIGGTGSGKTSLVHLIPRFYDATNGTVYINGLDVKEYSFENIRKKVGIVMQKAVLFKGTIRSNMEWASKSAIEDDFLNAISDAQAVEVVEQKGGIDGKVEPGGKNFSGGQRQRLSIARTLLSKPEILILDDSSSALDYLTDLNLRKAIKNLDYNPTVLIVSQRSASIMHADKIIVLDDGNMVGIGKHEELLKTCEVYKEIYESQYSEEAG